MASIAITGSLIEGATTQNRYAFRDESLLTYQNIQETFGKNEDYIEYYIFDPEGNILYENSNYTDYKLPSDYGQVPTYQVDPNIDGSIENATVGVVSNLSTSSSLFSILQIDPIKDVTDLYTSGEFRTQYNFFERIPLSLPFDLFIKEISADRTELRVGSFYTSNENLEANVNNLINVASSSIFFQDYLLNFGNNIQSLVVNIALNKVEPNYEVLFKLYEPLPANIVEKQVFNVVKEKVTPQIFRVNVDKLIYLDPGPVLRGPNFDIKIKDQGTIATPYQNYNSLVLYQSSSQSSSYRQVINLLNDSDIDINVDYTDFSNFVFFGSAEARVTNFYTKVKQIEDYSNLIQRYTPSASLTSSFLSEITLASSSINNIISAFDGFEYYLYFESSSITASSTYAINPYPKSGSIKPYVLFSTSSVSSSLWYNNALTSSQNYDQYNVNNLEYSIPYYLQSDPNNQNYLTFLNMMGQFFDSIWIPIKSVTDINLANNNLDKGISRDLVYIMLQSLGINVYNSFGNINLNQYLIGANTGSVFTSSLIDFSATSSYLNNIPYGDLVAESYKRIYHNLPLLLKQKGTAAGLKTLISLFGIPSRTYITGSTISSSILTTNEYGGSLKKDILLGYNNSKIRAINTTITGSVLSPFISLQIMPSNSSAWRNADENYIDVSFSPQSQIDTYVSKSISASNPNWVIDDYIGDPGFLYSSSYADLDTQRTIYMNQGTGSYPGFTGSLMDYNGFIRLIQFFDNSLFKMLNDYVPARTSLSTGVTINSPVLERNKVNYSKPNTSTNQSIYTGTSSIASMSVQYGKMYDFLSGDKKPFYTGELSGSIVNINQYFEDNYNPYLQPLQTSSDQYAFQHSDFNVLLNNVSQSIYSNIRSRLELIYGTTQSLLLPAELQDSYLYLDSYNNSRYIGCQVSSLTYNTYTTASDTYPGDDSFGKTAAIDRYSRKIGLFTQIESSSFLNQRNIVALKYLVDESGNLTDLNQRNKHWEEVQRLFSLGSTTTVALFDNQKFATNQRFTDGPKNIYESGYSYDPVLYFDSCSVSDKLYFTNLSGFSSYLATANNTSPYTVSGSTAPSHSISQSYVNDIFDNIIEGSTYLTAGTFASPPTYSVQEGGNHNLFASIGFSASISPVAPTPGQGTITGSLILVKSGSSHPNGTILATSNIATFTFTTASNPTTGSSIPNIYRFGTTAPTITRNGTVYSNKPIKLGANNYPAGTAFYDWSLGSSYYSQSDGTCNAGGTTGPLPGTIYTLTSAATSYTAVVLTACTGYNLYKFDTIGSNFWNIPNFDTVSNFVSSSTTLTINKTGSNPLTNLAVGDKLSLRLNISASNPNFTASITQGSLSISSAAVSTGYVTLDCPYFYTSSINIDINATASINSGSNTLIFKSDVSNYINSTYQFVPNPLTGSVNVLYPTYGDVNYPLTIKPYDLLVVQLSDNSYVESRILSIDTLIGGYLQLTLDTVLSSTYVNDIYQEKYKKFLILSRRQDETNMYIIFSKAVGQTSYGFIIPEDISPDILSNIDTITKEVKQKILSDTQGVI